MRVGHTVGARTQALLRRYWNQRRLTCPGDLPPGTRLPQLVDWLHPDGLVCPRCRRDDRMAVHRRGREPVTDFRCGSCRRVFNAFTGTALHGIRRRPRELVLILRGLAQGVPTAEPPGGCCRPSVRRGLSACLKSRGT